MRLLLNGTRRPEGQPTTAREWGLVREGGRVRAWLDGRELALPDTASVGVAFVENGSLGDERPTLEELRSACAYGSSAGYAWWDGTVGRLYWERDWSGSVPIFAHRGPDRLVVGPSPLAVCRQVDGVAPDPDVLRRFYDLDFETDETGLKGIERAPRHPVPLATRPLETCAADAVLDALREAVRRAISGAKRSACLLSGGVDSAAIAAIMVGEARRLGLPSPLMLTMSYPGLPEDETAWAEATAEHLGAEWVTSTTVSPMEGWAERVDTTGVPLLDPEGPEFTELARCAAREGCDVLLTGLGAEELFGPKGLDVELLRRGLVLSAWRLNRSTAEAIGKRPWPTFLRRSVRRALSRAPWGAGAEERVRHPDLQRTVAHAAIESPTLACRLEMATRMAAPAGATVVHPLYTEPVLATLRSVTTEDLFAGGVLKGLLREAVAPLLPSAVVGRVRKANHALTHRARLRGDRHRWQEAVRSLQSELGPELGPPADTSGKIDRFLATGRGAVTPWIALGVGEFIRRSLRPAPNHPQGGTP